VLGRVESVARVESVRPVRTSAVYHYRIKIVAFHHAPEHNVVTENNGGQRSTNVSNPPAQQCIPHRPRRRPCRPGHRSRHQMAREDRLRPSRFPRTSYVQHSIYF
jgi:hypothetical protein